MQTISDAVSKWLTYICVGAFLCWLPFELLRGVIPASSVYDFIKDQAFANVATAFGALGTILAIVGTAAVAHMQINAAAEAELKRKQEARRVFSLHLIQIAGICAGAERRFHSPQVEVAYLVGAFPLNELSRGLEKLDALLAANMTDLFLYSLGESFRGLLLEVVRRGEAVRVAHNESLNLEHDSFALSYSLEVLLGWYRSTEPALLRVVS